MMRSVVSNNSSDWLIVNDTVMGGLSTSQMVQRGESVRFEGVLSTQNNGGFNSTRTSVLPSVDDFQSSNGFFVQWNGSNRRFQIIVHLLDRKVREYYRCFLSTDSMEILWSDFEFRARGTIDSNRELSLDVHRISEVGILLSDGIEEPWYFELEHFVLLRDS